MIPTYIGVIVAFVGLVLLARRAELSLAFFAYCTLMSGASAIDLNLLGGASLPPAILALAFLGLRLARKDIGRSPSLLKSLQLNGLLVIFACYCALTAFIFPKLFAGRVFLIAMGTSHAGVAPLIPSAQNVTTAVYLLCTALAAVAACMLALQGGVAKLMANTFIIITWLHVTSGVLDLALNAVHQGYLLDIFRNGHYAQLDQNFGDVHRIGGITPEPSAYAYYAGALLIIMSEFWLRNIFPRRSGPAAVAMFVLLLLTTSTTGYVYLALYGFILWSRIIFSPASVPAGKIGKLLLFHIFGASTVIIVAALNPRMTSKFIGILKTTTFDKATSDSGVERAEWARQGLIAIKGSYGLGVGVGSFRSSSIITAILGSVGPVALVVFLGYVAYVWKPFNKSTYQTGTPSEAAMGASTGWAALLIIVAATFSAPSPDPGVLFGLLAGLALGWRAPHYVQKVRAGRRFDTKVETMAPA